MLRRQEINGVFKVIIALFVNFGKGIPRVKNEGNLIKILLIGGHVQSLVFREFVKSENEKIINICSLFKTCGFKKIVDFFKAFDILFQS